MQLLVEEGPSGVTQAALVGRMDIEGAQAVETPFQVLTRLRRALVVDLSQVSFMASMGLRTLMVGARNQSELGGKLVLASPQPNVQKVLKESGIGDLIGVYPTVEAATAAISA
jgi:anti-anti-sigma factor